jgi:phenylacetate-CoA ligase
LFAFGLTKENVKRALNWSRDKSPVVGGYASSLYVLSQLAEKENSQITFKSAISWGDKLFDHYRANIERVFKCKVYETYGASEGLMMAAQKDLDFMYIMLPCIYIEILDDDGNEVPDGEIGNVIVTSLVHEAMPLIRYKLGDLAIKLPKEQYPECREIALPLLQKVIGRETDIVETKSGKKLIVHSFTGIFEYYPSIKQFCVIQIDLEGVEIEYIKDDNFKITDIESIGHRLRELVGEDFEFKFTEVEFIAPTNSGKPQIIISKLK